MFFQSLLENKTSSCGFLSWIASDFDCFSKNLFVGKPENRIRQLFHHPLGKDLFFLLGELGKNLF